MATYKLLSYPLADKIPSYGGSASLDIQPVKAIKKGDSANVFRFTLQNHWGTHMDCPNHFFDEGKRTTDYAPQEYFFHAPQVIQVDLKPSQVLECDGWVQKISPKTDIVLFQSGWHNRRGEKEYATANPGLSPEVGFHLRKNFPNIRAVGMDWISVSAFQNREVGRQAHKAFLDPQGQARPLWLIEDMDLSGDLTQLQEVIVMPLLIEGVDSAPCTVVGKMETKG